MAWDPVVLRKYNTTGHFRLLNQLRGELKANPLVRPKDGERVGDVNRSRSLVRALEGASGSQRSRRGARGSGPSSEAWPAAGAATVVLPTSEVDDDSAAAGFRDRLNAIDLR